MISKSKLLELMKRFEEIPLDKKRLTVMRNHDHLVIVKDSVKDYLFGKIEYRGKGRIYGLEVEGEQMKLSYSNLERIFANNKKINTT